MFQDFYGIFNLQIEENNNDQIKQIENSFLFIERIQNIDFVSCFIEELKCPICYNIVIEPKSCKQCEKSFCDYCLTLWIDQQKAQLPHCPCCRKSLSRQKQPSSKLLLTLLNKLQIICKNKSIGCQEIIGYDQLQKHETIECLYVYIKCDNQECWEIILRKDLQQHKQVCQYERISCIKCSEIIERYQMDIHLLEKCPFRESECKWCHSTMEYRDLLSHQIDCPCGYEICKNCNTKYKIDNFKKHTKLNCMKKQKNYFKMMYEKGKLESESLIQSLNDKDREISLLQKLLNNKLDQDEYSFCDRNSNDIYQREQEDSDNNDCDNDW